MPWNNEEMLQILYEEIKYIRQEFDTKLDKIYSIMWRIAAAAFVLLMSIIGYLIVYGRPWMEAIQQMAQTTPV